MLRIALTVVLLILSQAANAYPAVPAVTYKCNGGAEQSTAQAAAGTCASAGDTYAVAAAVGCSGAYSGALYSATSCPASGTNIGTYLVDGEGIWYCSPARLISCHIGANTCPNGGTLSGATCNCAAGETDTGSACVAAACPSAGSPMGYHALTVGWALSPTVGANDIVGGFGTNLYGATHCVPNSSEHCGATIDPSAAAQSCWRSQAPADGTGLYRLSCDFALVSAGTSTCTPSGNNPSNPTAASPACPTGNVGEVNGKSVCLGSIPTSGVNLGAPEGSGNPRAGTGSEQTNEQREPAAGSGGAPDARGGPGVTTGPGGTGTGGNRIPSGDGKAGEAPKFPDDYNRENTQAQVLAELKKARKIDETGTPDGSTADTDAKAALDTEAGKLQTGLDGVIAGTGAPDRSWGFSISFPSTCNPFVVGTANWGFFNVDFCDFQDVAHDLMTLVWLGVTIFACVGMVFRAVSAG